MTRIATRIQTARLEEIASEMVALLREAQELVRGTSEEGRFQAYVYGHIRCHLDDNHSYLGHHTSIADVAEELTREREAPEEEDEE